jgi:hypothetical protein
LAKIIFFFTFLLGPIGAVVIPPIRRKYFGYVPSEPIPTTYPSKLYYYYLVLIIACIIQVYFMHIIYKKKKKKKKYNFFFFILQS